MEDLHFAEAKSTITSPQINLVSDERMELLKRDFLRIGLSNSNFHSTEASCWDPNDGFVCQVQFTFNCYQR